MHHPWSQSHNSKAVNSVVGLDVLNLGEHSLKVAHSARAVQGFPQGPIKASHTSCPTQCHHSIGTHISEQS